MKKLLEQFDKKCCETCFFYCYTGWTDDDEKQYGKCVRFPPVYIGIQELENFEPLQWQQPRVYPETTVCGEWKKV